MNRLWGKGETERGFSLVELLTVVALIGIVITIAALSSDFIRSHRLTAASRQMLGDFQKVRQDAMTRRTESVTITNSKGFGILFSSNSAYSQFEFNDANDNYTFDTGENAEPQQRTFSSGVRVERSDETDPTGDVYIYDKRGILRDNTWTPVTGTPTLTYVLKYSGVSQARCIRIEPVRIREGTWDGATCNVM